MQKRSERLGDRLRTLCAGVAALGCLGAVACGGDTPSSPEDNPLPSLVSLDPTLVVVGQATADVTLLGTGFVEGSHARLDGTDRATTFVGSEQLTMSLTSSDLSAGGVHEVVVVNGPPGGGTSGAATLTIGFPRPSVSTVSPLGVDAGAPSTTLTIDGAGFVDGASTVRFGYQDLSTTFVSATRLTAEAPAGLLADGRYVDVMVINPGPGGGASSAVHFTVRRPSPVLVSASPTTIVGGVDTRISVVGDDFSQDSELIWDQTGYPVHFVSETVLYADLPGSAFTSAGSGTIRVSTPAPGGGVSNSLDVVVVDPPPRISGFTPPSAQEGAAAFELTIHGANFSANSQVLWNGVARTTTPVDDETLHVDVSAADVANAGSGMIAVREPNGAESSTVGFPIVEATATVTDSLSIALTTTDLVAAPTGDVVYAVVPSTAGAYANEVVALSPSSGGVLWHAPVGSDPQRVVVSDDGAYLYVALEGAASVSRIDVSAQAKDLDIPMPASSWRAEDLLVLPGLPTSIAVSLRNTCCSPRHEGVVVFDGDVQRPLATQGHTGSDRIEPSSSPERIYGYNNETTEFGFRRILVRSDGLLQDGVYGGVVDGFNTDIIYDSGLLFTTRGRVIEPESHAILGTIPGSGTLRPDVANGRVHFLSNGVLTAYHYATFTELGSLGLPSANGLSVLVRFGVDGLAAGGGDRVLFVRSPLIGS